MANRRKKFTVTLSPSEYDGLVRAMVAYDMELDNKTEPHDWMPGDRRDARNAALAFAAIRDAYHAANPEKSRV